MGAAEQQMRDSLPPRANFSRDTGSFTALEKGPTEGLEILV